MFELLTEVCLQYTFQRGLNQYLLPRTLKKTIIHIWWNIFYIKMCNNLQQKKNMTESLCFISQFEDKITRHLLFYYLFETTKILLWICIIIFIITHQNVQLNEKLDFFSLSLIFHNKIKKKKVLKEIKVIYFIMKIYCTEANLILYSVQHKKIVENPVYYFFFVLKEFFFYASQWTFPENSSTKNNLINFKYILMHKERSIYWTTSSNIKCLFFLTLNLSIYAVY